jgi:hypothetical protein
MIWLTWRQFRSQAVTSLAVLAAFAILLGGTGPHLAGLYAGSGVASCHGQGSIDELARSQSVAGVPVRAAQRRAAAPVFRRRVPASSSVLACCPRVLAGRAG